MLHGAIDESSILGMRPEHLEAWVLSLVDQVAKGAKVEDSRIELKAEWPEARAAARRIAGHANASGGDAILWVIGLDENRGILAVAPADIAKWYAQVSAEFDGVAPSLTDLSVPTHSGTLISLLFDTVRRPYVVKNPVHGNSGGGPVSLEVPWRSGTAIRSARREELIRILTPLQTLPIVELLSASASATRNQAVHSTYDPTPELRSEHIAWNLDLTLYVIPRSAELLVLPVHKSSIRFRHGGGSLVAASTIKFHVPTRFSGRMGSIPDSQTITATSAEVVIAGPGKLHASASYYEPVRPLPSHERLEIAFSVTPAGSDRAVEITTHLTPSQDGDEGKRSWAFESDSLLE